jgi:hypothetical protein
VAIQRLGHGHDRQNQPSIQQGSLVHFGHHGLFHQMGGGHPYEVSNIKGYYQFYQRACYSQVWDSSDHHDRWRIGLISEEFRKFTADVGIKLVRSSPYYAQANGQAEASNQSLIKLIKRKIDEHPRRWHEVLSEALWAHRISCHGATKTSLYHRVYGQEAVLPWEITVSSRRVEL